MKDWVLSLEGDKWSVKYDVRDLGCHLDTTFRLRLVISRLVFFALPLDFHGRVRVVRSVYLPAALHIEEVLTGAAASYVHLFVADVIKSFDTVDRGILDRVLSSLGLPAWFRHAYFRVPPPCSFTVQACRRPW